MSSHPVRINALLRPVSSIRQAIERNQRALRGVRRALPPYLREHCLDCVIRNDKLFVYTDSSAWASQLRFYKSAILDAGALPKLPVISQVHIRICLPYAHGASTPRYQRTPSAAAIAHVAAAAQTAPDPPLRAALQRLERSLRSRSSRPSPRPSKTSGTG
jgi:hypothetical protein